MNKIEKFLFSIGSWLWLKTLGRFGEFKNFPATFDELNKMMTEDYMNNPNYHMDYWDYETVDENGKPAFYKIYFRGFSKGRIIRIY